MPLDNAAEKENLLINNCNETCSLLSSSLGSANVSSNNELLYENSNFKEYLKKESGEATFLFKS